MFADYFVKIETALNCRQAVNGYALCQKTIVSQTL